MQRKIHEHARWDSADTFMAAMRYASSASAIVIQAFFAAAQIRGAYEGEQRDGNALISDREFRLAKKGVWRWVYATKAVHPTKKQTILWNILHSIEEIAGAESVSDIRALARSIAGCVCGLVRIAPGSSEELAAKGIVAAPGARFYRFVEVFPLATPVPVECLRNSTSKRPKWATRYLTFGLHVAPTILYKLTRQMMSDRIQWLSAQRKKVQHTSSIRTRTTTLSTRLL